MGFVFALGFFGIIAIILIVFGVLMAIGLILIIVYCVTNSKAKKRGERASKVPLVFGLISLLFPIVLALGIVIAKAVEYAGYDNFRERWQNDSWINGTNAKYDVIEEFFPAADRGDKGAIIAMFTESRQKSPTLEKQVDAFLAEYPGGFSELDIEFLYNYSDGLNDFDRTAVAAKDGKRYYIRVGGCCSYYNDPTKIGLEYIIIESEDAYTYHCDNDIEAYNEYSLIHFNGAEYKNMNIRTIGEHPYSYTETERSLTAAELEDAAADGLRMYELTDLIGEPNAKCSKYGHYVYELAPSEEYAYAIVHVDHSEIDYITYAEPRDDNH